MARSSRPTSQASSFVFWSFIFWFILCVGFYCLNIPLRLINDLNGLLTALRTSSWDGLQVLSIQLSHALTLLIAFAYLSLFLAIGERALKIFGNVEFTKLEKWIWSFALGMVLWGLTAEVLALVGLLYIKLLQMLVVFVFVVLVFVDRTWFFQRCWPFEKEEKLPWLWKWVVGSFVLLTFSNLFAPEMSWDAITYQLVLPRYYLDHHGFYGVQGIVPSHSPSLGQMFFSWGLIWGSDSIARFFCFWSHLATVFCLVALGTRLGTPRAGWYAGAFYGLFPYLNIYSTRGYVDLFAGFYSVLGLSLLTHLVLNDEDCSTKGRWFLGAMSLSVVWAIKYNAIVYALTAISLWIWMGSKKKGGAFFVIWLFVLSTFFWAPWALKSWVDVHDPFFPYLTDWLHAFDWNEFDQKASWIKFPVEGFKGILRLPSVLFGIFFSNYSGAPNEEIGLSLLVFMPLLFLKPSFKRTVPVLMFVAGIPFLAWLVTSHQLRLITPVIAVVSFLAALGFEKALQLWPDRDRSLTFFPLALAVLSGLYLFQGLLAQPDPFPHFLGLQTREAFLEQIMRPSGYVEVNRYLNQTLPANAKVLILGQQNGYYLDRTSAYDFDYSHALLKSWADRSSTPEDLYRQFRENGFDYILYNSNGMMGQVVRLEELGLDRYFWSPAKLRNYEQFFLKYTEKVPLPVAGGYSLYRLTPRTGYSPLPEYLPGTERFYLDTIAQLMGLKKTAQIVGRNIPPEVYTKSYDLIANHYLELGYPCFQSALADLAGGKVSIRQVLQKGKVGYERNGDNASWLSLQGDVLLRQGHFRQAVPFLEKAQALSPEREDLARNLTLAYYNERQLAKALDEAAMAVKLAPSSDEDRKILAQLQSLLTNH